MMEIGRKIYFERSTGNVILDTGERVGSVVETSIEQDIESYAALAERVRDSFDVIRLPYGMYADDFNEAVSYRVNLDTRFLEFEYRTGNEEAPTVVTEIPLSEKVAQLESSLKETDTALLELIEFTFGGM